MQFHYYEILIKFIQLKVNFLVDIARVGSKYSTYRCI